MKPPICSVCHRRGDPGTVLVTFADHEPLPEGMLGHPKGLEWICREHVDAARALTHLRSAEAIERIRSARPG